MSTGLRGVHHARRALKTVRAWPPAPAVCSRRTMHKPPSMEHKRPSFGMVPQHAASTSASTSTPAPTSARLAQHLNDTFKPLQFPPDLAQRVLTHLSHRDAVQGHNARFAFMGRRVLEAYLLLFLHSLPPDLAARYDYERTAARVLNTYVLGEHVAPKWNLNTVIRWSSPRGDAVQAAASSGEMRSVGLYKVAGTAVEAVMGGVFHQFGGAVAHRLFHTRLLPHILLPGRPDGLPDALHDHAKATGEKMGGVHGLLLAARS